MGFILLIIILGVVVVVHEYGHYIAAKKFGVKVEEFGFGFPPRAKKLFKRGETLFSLNWIPFGGFVKLFGENPEDAHKEGEDQKRNLNSKPRWQQAIILFAGVFMNFMLAGVLFSIGFMSGMPISVDSNNTIAQNKHVVIVSIQKDSPAEVAGLPAGVSILALDGKPEAAQSVEAMQQYVRTHAGTPIDVTYQSYTKGKKIETVSITPKEGLASNGKAGIGVGLDLSGEIKLPFFRAIGEGFATAGRMVAQIVIFFIKFIGGLFGAQTAVSGSDVTGPGGIAGLASQAYRMGIVYLLTFVAVISANLAVLNLIPFPALDGGRLLFLGIEGITRKKMNPKVIGWVNTIGFFLLILLMIFVTYRDVAKLI
jgi:regulator of sigma E protease